MRDALRRQQKYFKSGAPAEAIKEWKFQKQMGFLQPYMANKSREGNLREDDENENVTQDSEEYETFADVDDENVEVNIQQQDQSIEDESQPQKLSQTLPPRAAETPTSNATPKSAKKFKKDNVTALLKQSMEKREERCKARMEERKKIVQESKSTENDPLFHFFMSMYQSTKIMPPSYQHQVKNRVFNVVSDVEARLLDVPVQQQHYPAPASIPPYSSSSTPAYSYSDNSLLSPADTLEEQENSTTAANSDNLINYINTFTHI